MKLKPDKVKELMELCADGNYNKFSRQLEVDPSQLYRFINYNIGGGKKMVLSIIKYCKAQEIDFEKYIEL